MKQYANLIFQLGLLFFLSCTAQNQFPSTDDKNDQNTKGNNPISSTGSVSGNYSSSNTGTTDTDSTPTSSETSNTSTFSNKPPVFEPINDLEVKVSDKVEFEIKVSDPDNDEIDLNTDDLPAQAVFTKETLKFSWVIPESMAGKTVTITFIASDKESFTEESVNIIIQSVGTGNNNLPIIENIGDKTGLELEKLEFKVTATDVDGDALTLSMEQLPSGSTFNPVDKTFSWTPVFGSRKVYTVKVKASDGKDQVEKDFKIEIKPNLKIKNNNFSVSKHPKAGGDGDWNFFLYNPLLQLSGEATISASDHWMIDSSNTVGGESRKIAVGDYNGDGKTEIAVLKHKIGNAAWDLDLFVYKAPEGLGVVSEQLWADYLTFDETFIEGTHEYNHGFVKFMTSGDFNSDGKDELAVIRQPLDKTESDLNLYIYELPMKNDERSKYIFSDFWTYDNSPDYGGKVVGLFGGDFDGNGKAELATMRQPLPDTNPGDQNLYFYIPPQKQGDADHVNSYNLLDAWTFDVNDVNGGSIITIVSGFDANKDGKADLMAVRKLMGTGSSPDNLDMFIYSPPTGKVVETKCTLIGSDYLRFDQTTDIIGKFE